MPKRRQEVIGDLTKSHILCEHSKEKKTKKTVHVHGTKKPFIKLTFLLSIVGKLHNIQLEIN